MKKLSLLLIDLYQNFISPYKGFSCAHRLATGEVGCSGYGKKVISRFGLKTGYALLQRRFAECKCSSEALKKELMHNHTPKKLLHPKMASQQGFCDADCGGCDAPNCDMPSCDMPDCDLPGKNCSVFDACDCCDIPDCGSKNKTKISDDKYQQRVQKKMEKKKAKEEAKKVSLKKDSGTSDWDSDGDGDGGD
jgi:putative component of membrane protein insertase Oxa1/YidC/SpoIIIJ protein YidD